MSWDVCLIRTKKNDEYVEEISSDNIIPFKQMEIAEEIKAISGNVAARYNCDDLSWQTMEAATWSIEFNVGEEEENDAVMLQIRGGEEPIEVLKALANDLRTRILDCSKGNFMEFNSASGFSDWKAYRDRVIGDNNVY